MHMTSRSSIITRSSHHVKDVGTGSPRRGSRRRFHGTGRSHRKPARVEPAHSGEPHYRHHCRQARNHRRHGASVSLVISARALKFGWVFKRTTICKQNATGTAQTSSAPSSCRHRSPRPGKGAEAARRRRRSNRMGTLRLTGGTLRSRSVRTPSGRAVRPTPARVKEALFSILADRIDGAVVLDLFAGTGALGFEALSRGAAHGTFVEQHRPTAAALRGRAQALGLADRTTVLRCRPSGPRASSKAATTWSSPIRRTPRRIRPRRSRRCASAAPSTNARWSSTSTARATPRRPTRHFRLERRPRTAKSRWRFCAPEPA